MQQIQQHLIQPNSQTKTNQDTIHVSTEINDQNKINSIENFSSNNQFSSLELDEINLLKMKESSTFSLDQQEKGENYQSTILKSLSLNSDQSFESQQLLIQQQTDEKKDTIQLQQTIQKKNRFKSQISLNNISINSEQKETTEIEQNQKKVNLSFPSLEKKESIQLFNNQVTKVTLQYNKQTKQLTIKKYFKDNDIEKFQNEIKILKLLVQEKITLPLVSYSENNELWYEQVAGCIDFLIIKKSYLIQEQRTYVEDLKYLEDINRLFCKLFNKLDKMFKLGFAHSDIKPQNIVIGFDSKPYFIDFGGAVKINDYENYLNYFTPFYNHPKYYENKDGFLHHYTFQDKNEVKQCDRTQLALSFLYMIAFDYDTYEKEQRKNKVIPSMYKYFRDKNYNQIMKYKIDEDFFFLKAILTNCSDLQHLNKISLQILQMIEQPDYYLEIKKKLKNNEKSISTDYFHKKYSIYQQVNFKNVNKYNIPLINVYFNTRNQFEISINKPLDIAQYFQKDNIITQSISKLKFDQLNKEMKINLTIQNIPGNLNCKMQIDHGNYKRYLNQQERQNIYKNCFNDIIEIFKNSKTLSDRSQIQQQLSYTIIQLTQGKCLNILDEYQILQDKIFDQVAYDVKNICNNICNVFQQNAFIIEIYNEDFVNDKFINEIWSYCNQINEVELSFIDCRFKNDFYIQLNKFLNSFQKYDIFWATQKQLVQATSIKCKSNQTNPQKRYIKLSLLNKKKNIISGTNIFDFSLKQQNDSQTVINSSPFCVVLSDIESGYFQNLLKFQFIFLKDPIKNSYFKIKNKNYDNEKDDKNKNNNSYFYPKSIITDEDNFFKYLNTQKNSYVIIIVKATKYMILVSNQKDLEKYFINFESDIDQGFNDYGVLLISRNGMKKQIEEVNSQKNTKKKNKMIKPLIPAEQAKINIPQKQYSEEENMYDKELIEISAKQKFCLEINELFDNYALQFSQVDSYEQYTIEEFKKDYLILNQKFIEIEPKLLQYDISIDKSKQINFQDYFRKKFNPLYTSDELMDWLFQYSDDFEQCLYNIIRSQQTNMIEGKQLYKQFLQQQQLIQSNSQVM